MSETVIVTTGDSDESSNADVAAAEANAHIAERAEEDAEEAAETAEEAAEEAEQAAEAAESAAVASVGAAVAASEAAVEAEQIAESIPDMLSRFADDVISRMISVLSAREEQGEEDGGIGIELSLDSEPPVPADVAPAEQHPYFKKWGKR